MMKKHTIRWWLQATLGLLFTGAGLSMAIDAGFQRFAGNPYVLYATAALVVFHAGICLVVDAGRYRNPTA